MLQESRAEESNLLKFGYQLIRYYPDNIRCEFVTIGVIVWEVEGTGSPVVRMTRDWRRVRCLDPEADTDYLEAMEEQWTREMSQPDGRAAVERLCNSLSLSVRLTELQVTLAPTKDDALRTLLDLYVEWKTRPSTGSEDTQDRFVPKNP